MVFKCPYCGGNNLYLQRTFPIEVYGCNDCQAKSKMLQGKGLTKKEIEFIIKGDKK